MGLALGARPARAGTSSARRWPRSVRARVRDPRRRARPRLPASRERARAVARARPRVRAHLDAQRDAPVRRREDVEVARQRRLDPQRRSTHGDASRAALLPDRALAQADRLHRRDARAGEGAGRGLPRTSSARRASRSGTGSASRRRSTTTSTRPRRSRSCTGGATTSSCATRSACFGLASLAEQQEAPAEIVELAERRETRARQGLRRGRPAPRRDRGRGLGGARRGRRLPARARGDARAGLRPPPGARGAARAARGARAVGDRARGEVGAVAARARAAARPGRSSSATSREAAGTRDHQGVLAWCEPYKYADA